MSIHYFIVGLKPLFVEKIPPISCDDFLLKAKSSLSGPLLEDLLLVARLREIIAHVNKSAPLPAALLYSFFMSIHHDATSFFLKRIAIDIIEFYAAVSFVLTEGTSFIEEESLLSKMERPNISHYHRLKSLNQANMALSPELFEHDVVRHLFLIIDDNLESEMFSSDQIIAYFIKLMMLERLASFDQDQGKILLERLIKPFQEGASNE